MPEESPDAPPGAVRVWEETAVIPTYEPAAPDRNPMFLEKRVYQGSSGRVYPLPFTDRIAEQASPRPWRAVWIENEFLRVMILPEIGGRIHRAVDRTNGCDFIYHQRVIKPALVGLAGPWISGGIEFNWPQHHRPATFMPVDVRFERHAGGSATVWCGDHDPMARMKGMHGVCLHPGRAVIELKVRAYNRTPHIQTFLWWANVATRVHEAYQSFFPPDVRYVADHARRATSAYPLCRGQYYGVDYAARARRGIPPEERPGKFMPRHCLQKVGGRKSEIGNGVAGCAPNDLSWYANIPVPTSYMCMGSKEDFFGGYDHAARAGIVHVAGHHISPGKKQWTWGNHEFGYAWDRNLTDDGGPYIEIMAGVYTDNQPDFSFLMPGETKAWSQHWYPIREIGPAHHANIDAAVSLRIDSKHICIGVAVTSAVPGSKVRLERPGAALEWAADLAPDRPFVIECPQSPKPWPRAGVTLRVLDSGGREIIAYTSRQRIEGAVPPGATEPPPPEEVKSADELHVIGLHLDQYRHATRCPTLYWREALRRDPGDARCNNAMGLWRLRRGEFPEAEEHFRAAVARLTSRNANPCDGEPYYNLGLCLRYRLDGAAATQIGDLRYGRQDARATPGIADFLSAVPQASGLQALFDAAYAAFYKATWNQAWQAAAFHALAEMDCRRGDWTRALDHADRALRTNADNLRARNLKAILLRRLGRDAEAGAVLDETLALDPLDAWAGYLAGGEGPGDLQTALDIALDFARAGLFAEGAALLERGAGIRACLQPPGAGDAGANACATARSGCHNGSADARDLGSMPMVHYTIGWLRERMGDAGAAAKHFHGASALPPEYCFPARIEEMTILETAIRANPGDARACHYLGCLLYDRRRHEAAIRFWERAAKLDPSFPTAWRNLGIGYFNIMRKPARARAAYERAFRADPSDARVLYERDQLWKRVGESPARRLRELEKHLGLVRLRDDLSIEFCALLNQAGRYVEAMRLLAGRRFQPWEGGEGLALGQHARTQMALGREALAHGDFPCARRHFENALACPENLGEARHLLANCGDIHYRLGCACEAAGDRAAARMHWRAAAASQGDFQAMSVRAFSEMTYFSALACGRLGQKARMRKLLSQLLAHARKLRMAAARIDYFATSLPTMLLFDDDIQARQETAALFIEAQALAGLGNNAAARRLLRRVLERDPSHAMAADLLQDCETGCDPDRIQKANPGGKNPSWT